MEKPDLVKVWDANFKALQEEDKRAKEEGKLVGRYLEEHYADGYAYYRIVRENKKSVRIEVVTGIGDDWVLPYWGEKSSISKGYAQESLFRRDAMLRLFKGV